MYMPLLTEPIQMGTHENDVERCSPTIIHHLSYTHTNDRIYDRIATRVTESRQEALKLWLELILRSQS